MAQISRTPIVAAADYATQPHRVEQEDLSEVRTGGPGWPTTLSCGDCGNTEGNVQIWHSWWVDRGGDATSNDEIKCKRCGLYTLYITEH
ncbi:MAG TPA: hypothetical protein PK156_31710 [Polyangium sp.]|nr:hypothetical protein [Polyangium sp.]